MKLNVTDAPSTTLPTRFHLIDFAARLETVAVEEEIAGDGAAVHAGKDIRAQSSGGLEIIRPRQAGRDPHRVVFPGQVESQPRHRAQIREVADVAARLR